MLCFIYFACCQVANIHSVLAVSNIAQNEEEEEDMEEMEVAEGNQMSLLIVRHIKMKYCSKANGVTGLPVI